MKTKWKWKMISLTVVLALVLGITGCGSATTGKSDNKTAQSTAGEVKPASETKATAEKQKISIWTTLSEMDINTLKQNILADILKEMDIDFVTIPLAEYERKLRIAISGGKAPDIFYVDGVYTANYAYIGALMPLDKYWDANDITDYVKSSQDKCVFDGKKYAMSLYETSCVLFYNKEHFEKAGITNVPEKVSDAWNYDKLVEAARKLTVKDGSGKIVQYGLQPGLTAPDIATEGTTFGDLLWLWNHGGEVFDEKMTTAKGYFNSEKSIKAIQDYASLFQTQKVSPLEGITQGFETGKISMMIHNIGASAGFIKNFPNLKLGVMPLPVGEKNYSTSGGWNIGISAQCKNPDTAWKVLNAIAGKDGHTKYSELFNLMPSRKSTLNSLKKLDEFPMKVAKELMLSTPRARPITPAYSEISSIIAETFNAAAYGDDPKSLTTKAADSIDKIMKKYPK